MTPATTMLAFAVLSLLASAVTLIVALNQPQLDIPKGATVLSVNGEILTEEDRYEEPDQLADYDLIKAFNKRQGELRAELDKPEVTLRYATAEGEEVTQTLVPRARTLADLPFLFWFQNGVALFSMLIGGWVLGLRPYDWGVRMFVGTTLFLPMAALSAAIYSTRQVALPETLFYTLSSLNATGSLAFGICLIAMFSQYPRSLYPMIWNVIPLAVFGGVIAMIVLQVGPNNMIGIGILSELLISMVLGVIQWVRSKQDPVNRAGLRWFILVTLTACSLFTMISSAPLTLGFTEKGLISQGLAFGFFNIMHVGLALGILRYRLFDLDRWSYYIWLWVSGMAMIFALDLVLINVLKEQPWVSLGTALLIGGFLYFPLRQLLMRLLLHRREASLAGRMPDIAGAALAPSFALQNERWDALLRGVFQPLAPPHPVQEEVVRPQLVENGLTLLVPGIDTLAPRKLRFALGGRRLFNRADLEIVETILQTYQMACDSRHAYERGVILERDRISKDIHDNIGAQLLSALHSAELARKDDLLRDSISDLRTIINDGFLAEYPLDAVLADLRLETAERLEVRKLRLIWRDETGSDGAPDEDADDQMMVPFEVVNGLRSILREAISNVLRHAHASEVRVRLSRSPSEITLQIADNGIGTVANATGTPENAEGGNGIPNILERAEALAGKGRIGARSDRASGTEITIELPLDPVAARAKLAAE